MPMRRTITVAFFFFLCVFGSGMTTARDFAELDTVDEADWGELAALMRYLRSEQRESLFVPVAKLQLAYLTQAASRVDASDPDQAVEIRRFARGVAYNIASFTWPGWGDSPEPISESRQELGLEAAERAVELAEKIEEMTPNALWILGAHQLNAGMYDEAISTFERAEELARNDFYRSMHEAWQQLTKVVASGGKSGLEDLDEAISGLRTLNDENAEFFAEQLSTARRVYIENSDLL